MNHLIKSTLILLSLSAGAATLAGAQSTDPNQSAPPQGHSQGQYQGHPHRAPDPNHQAHHLAKQLGLTPDQVAQVEPILAARDQQMQTLHQNPPADPKAMHQQMRAIQVDTDQKLGGIFTDQQKQTYAQMESERHHHGHHGQPDGAAQQQPTTQPSAA